METTIAVGIVALVVGYLIAKLLEKNKASSTLKNVKKQASTIFIASLPEIRTTAIAPAPDGVAKAIILSLWIMGQM